MAVNVKHDLLRYHSSLDFRLVHAAIGTYPVQGKVTLTVNRILMIFENSDTDKSFIRDTESNKSFILQPGTIYFIPCQHEVDMKLTERLSFVSFQFNLDSFYGFDVFRNYRKCIAIKNAKLISEAQTFFRKDTDTWMLCRINEIIFNICSFLLENYHDDTDINRLTASQHSVILEYVQKRGDATTTVADLAAMNKMRQDVFSRKFTHDMGITPKKMIDDTLLRKAAKLLIASKMSIKEIANELNFRSESYFSRFIKKHTGTSPRDFRHAHSFQ